MFHVKHFWPWAENWNACRTGLRGSSKLLEAYSYQGVLQRGYALVTDSGGKLVRKGKPLKTGEAVSFDL